MGGVKDFFKYLKDYQRQLDLGGDSNIKFINWWTDITSPEDEWLSKFINHRAILASRPQTSIAIFSVFGKALSIRLNRSDIKIFWTGENVHRDEKGFRYSKYNDHGLQSGIDLAVGFDYLNHPRYLRFPLWILYMVSPQATSTSDIQLIFNNLSQHTYEHMPTRFCSMISSHDPNGLRKEMLEQLSPLGQIASAGKFMNNTDELKTKYGDNKNTFMKEYRFNICPENSNTEGYVTEKIFEAIKAGSIPIYWGSNNKPEPEVLNPDAILFWQKGEDNTAIIKQIDELNNNNKLFKEFASQPRLMPHADEYLTHKINELEGKLRELL